MANLDNTLVVEYARHTSYDPTDVKPVEPECLESSSFVGGDIAAIGTSVYSFLSADGSLHGEDTGTSYSAPQVAALAAYIWGINPNLSIAEIITDLISTARAVPAVSGDAKCSDWTDPAPIIDAYDALLALDGVGTPAPATHKVRLAILDVNQDDTFDESDIDLILNALPDPAQITTPQAPDYGRFDLNGDGYTGDESTGPFDLDRTGSIPNGPMVYSTVTQTIINQQVKFDENDLTDLDVLCYYSYSPLYQGLVSERDDLLGSLCAPLTLIIGPHPNGVDNSKGVELAYANVHYYTIGSTLGVNYTSDPHCLDSDPYWNSPNYPICRDSDIPQDEWLNCDDYPFLTGGMDMGSNNSFAAFSSFTAQPPHTDELTARSSTALLTGRKIQFIVDGTVSGTTDGKNVYQQEWHEGFLVRAGGILGNGGHPSTAYLDITNPHSSDITIEISWDATGNWITSHRTPDYNEDLKVSISFAGLVRVYTINPCAQYRTLVQGDEFASTYFYKDHGGGTGTPTIEHTDRGYPGSLTFSVPPGRHQYQLFLYLEINVAGEADPHILGGDTSETGKGLALSGQVHGTFTIRNLGP
jgi:hypothetical protein